MKSLLRFDLSALPVDALIIDAKLELNAISGGWYEEDISLYPVHVAWPDAEATWQLAISQVPWNKAGCGGIGTDRAVSAVGSQLAVAGTPLEYSITGLVRQWTADPPSNHGLLLEGSYNIAVQHGLAASDHWYAAKRSKLVLTFARRQ